MKAEWKRLQETFLDATKIGSREMARSVDFAKRQLERLQLVQRRKELFAELGRTLYEATQDGSLPAEVTRYIRSTEANEVVEELSGIDAELAKLNS